MKLFCVIFLFFSISNAYSHGMSPVNIDGGFKPHGMKFPVKFRVYNNNKKPFSVDVFIRLPDDTVKMLGETTPIKPGGYGRGIDINVILGALSGITEVCTKMKSDNVNVNTLICSKVKIKTPGGNK